MAALPRIALYGLLLAAASFALQWLDYLRLVRSGVAEVQIFLIAAGFLALGAWLGGRVFARPHSPPFDGNPAGRAAIGLSARELTVLERLAAGRSNKEIAIELGISPNTVKTHVARLFEKLDSSRRTEAIARARALGLIR